MRNEAWRVAAEQMADLRMYLAAQARLSQCVISPLGIA